MQVRSRMGRIAIFLLCLNAAIPSVYFSVTRYPVADASTGGWGGDAGQYIRMYQGVPLDRISKPFRYRVLAPWLARLVPDVPASVASLYEVTPEKVIKFHFGVVNLFALAGAAFFTFLLCEALGFAPAECLIASLLFLTGFAVVNFAGMPLTDAVSFFFLAGAIVSVLREWNAALLVLTLVGMFAKETTGYVLVPILALRTPRATKVRQALLVLPGIAAYLVFRHVVSPTTHGWNYSVSDTLDNLRITLTSWRRQLWITVDGGMAFGLLWAFALAGLWRLARARRGDHPLARLAWLIPVALGIPILVYANIGRLWYLAFPAILPLAMLPVRSLLGGQGLPEPVPPRRAR